MTATSQPALQPFSGGASIPAGLREQNRWAPWRAVFNAKRGKFDKIAVRADNPRYGLSTANPARWFTYEAALAAHERSKGDTNGIGYCLTNPHGIVGVDIDGGVTDGVVDDWAAEIVTRLGGYAEFSPSGKGLRIFVEGEIAQDWCNHPVGVEVYAGHTPRFLTVSGKHLPGTPTTLRPAPTGALAWLSEKYRENQLQKKAQGDLPPMPLLLDVADIPPLSELGLPPRAHDFLAEGDTGAAGDRSRVLHSTSVALFSAGLSDVQVMSLLVNNPYAFEVALDHRRQDNERAMDYVWEHHVCAAKAKAMSSILTAADWVDEVEREYEERPEEGEMPVADGESAASAGGDDVVAMFEDLGADDNPPPATKPKAKDRFPIFQAGDYSRQSTRIEWLVPNVLPKAEVVSVFGESGAGKSFFILDLAVRMAKGMPWWDRMLKPRSILYVAAEGAVGVRLRLQAMARHFGVDLDDLPLHIMPAQPNLLANEDVRGFIQRAKKLGPLDLVIFDTLSQVTPGAAENSSEDMGKALAHCKTVHQVLGATICLIGHAGKNVSLGQRGWSGIKGAMDAQIEVTKTATYRSAAVTKLKDGTGEGAEFMFKLHTVVLDFDIEDGDITSAVVEPIMSEDQKDAAREAEEEHKARKKSGRPKGNGEWAQLVIEATQALCGPRNKPAHAQRILDEAERIAKQTKTNLPKQLAGAIRRGLEAVTEAARDLIHDPSDDTYTLKVPPEAPSSDD